MVFIIILFIKYLYDLIGSSKAHNLSIPTIHFDDVERTNEFMLTVLVVLHNKYILKN